MAIVLFRFQTSGNPSGKPLGKPSTFILRQHSKTLGGANLNLAKLAVFQIWARQLFRISPKLAKTVVACFQPLHDETLFGRGVIFLLRSCKHRVSSITYCMVSDVKCESERVETKTH